MNETPGLTRLEHAIADAWSQGPHGVLNAVRRTLDDRDEHVLTVADDEDLTWTIEHPLDCRITGLADCRYTAWAARHSANPGRYRLMTMGGDVCYTMLADERTEYRPGPRRR